MRNTQGSNIWSIPQSEHPDKAPIIPYIIYIYIYIHTYMYIYIYIHIYIYIISTEWISIANLALIEDISWHIPISSRPVVIHPLRPKHTSKTCVASNGSQDNIFQGYPAGTTIGPFFGPTNLVSKSGWCHWHVWELTKKNEMNEAENFRWNWQQDLPKRIKNKTRTPARGQSCKKRHWLEQTTAWT